MTFDQYTRSLECVTVSHLPEPERLAAAYVAGAASVGVETYAPGPYLKVKGEHLWTRIESAYNAGRSDHA